MTKHFTISSPVKSEHIFEHTYKDMSICLTNSATISGQSSLIILADLGALPMRESIALYTRVLDMMSEAARNANRDIEHTISIHV